MLSASLPNDRSMNHCQAEMLEHSHMIEYLLSIQPSLPVFLLLPSQPSACRISLPQPSAPRKGRPSRSGSMPTAPPDDFYLRYVEQFSKHLFFISCCLHILGNVKTMACSTLISHWVHCDNTVKPNTSGICSSIRNFTLFVLVLPHAT